MDRREQLCGVAEPHRNLIEIRETNVLDKKDPQEIKEDDRKFAGSNMWQKKPNVRCRIITANAASSLKMVMDRTAAVGDDSEGGVKIKYIHLVMESTKEMDA